MTGYIKPILPFFLFSTIRDCDGSKKKKRKSESNEVESLFNNKRSKKWLTEDSTPLLPIKDKNKLIQRAQAIERTEDSGMSS